MASNEPGPALPPYNRQPQLEQAQQAVEEALSQASRVNVRDADTGELIRIEEVLAIANEAATPIPQRWLGMTDDDILKLCDDVGRA